MNSANNLLLMLRHELEFLDQSKAVVGASKREVDGVQ